MKIPEHFANDRGFRSLPFPAAARSAGAMYRSGTGAGTCMRSSMGGRVGTFHSSGGLNRNNDAVRPRATINRTRRSATRSRSSFTV